MYKIVLFSDIHGCLEPLQAILKDIKKEKPNEIINLGDTIAIGPDSKKCLDLIIRNKIKTVLGNHELYYLLGYDIDDEMGEGEKKHHQWIASTLKPKYKEYLLNNKLEEIKEINNFKIAFKHFFLEEKTKNDYPFQSLRILNNKIKHEVKKDESDLIFIGHEHKPFQIETKNKKLVCAGTSGLRKDNQTFYIILTIDETGYDINTKYISYNRKKLEKKMKKAKYPEADFVKDKFLGIK